MPLIRKHPLIKIQRDHVRVESVQRMIRRADGKRDCPADDLPHAFPESPPAAVLGAVAVIVAARGFERSIESHEENDRSLLHIPEFGKIENKISVFGQSNRVPFESGNRFHISAGNRILRFLKDLGIQSLIPGQFEHFFRCRQRTGAKDPRKEDKIGSHVLYSFFCYYSLFRSHQYAPFLPFGSVFSCESFMNET